MEPSEEKRNLNIYNNFYLGDFMKNTDFDNFDCINKNLPDNSNNQINYNQNSVSNTRHINNLSVYKYLNDKQLEKIYSDVGYRFKDPHLLINSLTRKSAFAEEKDRILHSYERLEYYGDSLIKFIISDYLFEKFPMNTEGELTIKRNYLESNKFLSEISNGLNLCGYLIADITESNLITNYKLQADLFESLIGAIFIDSNKNLTLLYHILNIHLFNRINENTIFETNTNKNFNHINKYKKRNNSINFRNRNKTNYNNYNHYKNNNQAYEFTVNIDQNTKSNVNNIDTNNSIIKSNKIAEENILKMLEEFLDDDTINNNKLKICKIENVCSLNNKTLETNENDITVIKTNFKDANNNKNSGNLLQVNNLINLADIKSNNKNQVNIENNYDELIDKLNISSYIDTNIKNYQNKNSANNDQQPIKLPRLDVRKKKKQKNFENSIYAKNPNQNKNISNRNNEDKSFTNNIFHHEPIDSINNIKKIEDFMSNNSFIKSISRVLLMRKSKIINNNPNQSSLVKSIELDDKNKNLDSDTTPNMIDLCKSKEFNDDLINILFNSIFFKHIKIDTKCKYDINKNIKEIIKYLKLKDDKVAEKEASDYFNINSISIFERVDANINLEKIYLLLKYYLKQEKFEKFTKLFDNYKSSFPATYNEFSNNTRNSDIGQNIKINIMKDSLYKFKLLQADFLLKKKLFSEALSYYLSIFSEITNFVKYDDINYGDYSFEGLLSLIFLEIKISKCFLLQEDELNFFNRYGRLYNVIEYLEETFIQSKHVSNTHTIGQNPYLISDYKLLKRKFKKLILLSNIKNNIDQWEINMDIIKEILEIDLKYFAFSKYFIKDSLLLLKLLFDYLR